MKNVIMEKPKLRIIKEIKEGNPEKEGYLPFEKSLPKKIGFNYDESVVRLIEKILDDEEAYKIFEQNTDNLFIFLNPAKENFCEYLTMNLFKFLVFLKRESIISDLHLPLFIRKVIIRNEVKNIIEFSPKIIEEAEDIIDLAVKYEKNIRLHTINFRVKDWDKFHNISEKLEKQAKERLAKEKEPNPAEETKKELFFDSIKSFLAINGQQIKILKNSDQYHLLRIIFKDEKELPQEWFFSEIAENYDEMANLPDKKFYNAVYQINQKIIRDTGVRDFFITTKQSVKINDKYLKKT